MDTNDSIATQFADMAFHRSSCLGALGRCRSAVGLIGLSLSFWQTVEPNAAVESAKPSDVELSQRLVGNWESKLEGNRAQPVKRVFATFDSGKNFKLITIWEFPERQGRTEVDGKWRISNRVLVLEPEKSRSSQGSKPWPFELGFQRSESYRLNTTLLFFARRKATSTN